MNILVAFAPFFVFVVVERIADVFLGLVLATVTAAILLGRDLVRRREIKILEAGTLLLFGGLALYSKLYSPTWSIVAVRLRVDAGLLLIVLVSLMLRKPFTLQYARDRVAREWWSTPGFIRTNYIITLVWGVAFAVAVVAEAAILYVPSVPQRVGVIATIVAILGAYKFTEWYPAQQH